MGMRDSARATATGRAGRAPRRSEPASDPAVMLSLTNGKMTVWNFVPVVCKYSWPAMKCYLDGNCPDIQCLTLFTW